VTNQGGDFQTTTHGRRLAAALIVASALGSTQIAIAPPSIVRASGPAPGTITTVAGGGLGVGVATQISQRPHGLARYGSTLYIADDQANLVRALDTTTGQESVYAGTGAAGSNGDGGPATAAQITNPTALAVDSSGNLFISTTNFSASADNRIRKVDHTTHVITTVAGGGTSTANDVPATSAQLNAPQGVAVDTAGNVFISDTLNNAVREVDHTTGHISTVAGNGTSGFSGDGGSATSAQFARPLDLWSSGGNILVADSANFVIRSFTVGGNIQTVVGDTHFITTPTCPSGPALTTSLAYVYGVSEDAAGNIFLTIDNCVLEVSGGTISVVAGNGQNAYGTGGPGDGGPATSAALANPQAVVPDANGNVYLADYLDLKVRVVDHATHIINTVAGNGGVCSRSGDGGQATAARM
jgi:trimeric autotransporter adhesin